MIATGARGRVSPPVLSPAAPPLTRLALIVAPPFGSRWAPGRAAAQLEIGDTEPPASDVVERTGDLPSLVRQRLTGAWTVLNPLALDGAPVSALVHWCARYAVSRRRGLLALRAQGYDLAACLLWRRHPPDPAVLAAAGERLAALGIWLDCEALP